MKKQLKSLFVLSLVIAFALDVTGCGKKKEEEKEVARPVKTVTVEKGIGSGRTFPGMVQGSQRVNLSFRVAGPLIELPAKEGDEVEKGQLLAKIDPRDFRIAFEEARAKYERAQADHNRFLELYEEDAVPLADLEAKRALRDVERSKLEDVAADLKDTELRAPFKGIIGNRFVENFEDVQAKQEIMNMNDISKVEVIIAVPENVMATAKGDARHVEVTASFEATGDERFPLKIKELSTQADPATQTYKATLIMPQPEGVNILPGMTALVHMKASAGAEDAVAVFIPSVAVFAGNDEKTYVWVIDPETLTAHMREVKAGQFTGGGNIQILEGLNTGDLVAVAAIRTLREGKHVSLYNNQNKETDK